MKSALVKLDETHWEMVRRIHDITEHLKHATEELRWLSDERTGRTDELRHLTSQLKEATVKTPVDYPRE